MSTNMNGKLGLLQSSTSSVNIDRMRPCPFHAALHVCHAPAEDKIVYSGCECLWWMNTHIQSQ